MPVALDDESAPEPIWSSDREPAPTTARRILRVWLS
jgi:hypothetical protein